MANRHWDWQGGLTAHLNTININGNWLDHITHAAKTGYPGDGGGTDFVYLLGEYADTEMTTMEGDPPSELTWAGVTMDQAYASAFPGADVNAEYVQLTGDVVGYGSGKIAANAPGTPHDIDTLDAYGTFGGDSDAGTGVIDLVNCYGGAHAFTGWSVITAVVLKGVGTSFSFYSTEAINTSPSVSIDLVGTLGDETRGYECKLYRNAGSYADPSWLEVSLVRDLSLDAERSEYDGTTRGSGGFEAVVAGLLKAPTNFDMLWDDTNEGFQALWAAYVNNTPIELAVMDGSIVVAGVTGLRATFAVLKFGEGQPLDGLVTASLSIKPAIADNVPEWITITE